MTLVLPPVARTLADAALEASIVGSFSAIGYAARSRLEQWQDPPRMDGKRALVTGGSSGIGFAVAKGLAELGAQVWLTSRDQERADRAARSLRSETGLETIRGLALDLGSRPSIENAVASLVADAGSLDVIVNNAGALLSSFQTDSDGIELTVSTHLVGPFALTCLLKPNMVGGGVVLFMSSGGMYSQRLNVEGLQRRSGEFRGSVAYAKAKRAQVELVHVLGPRWHPELTVHAVHPGWVDTPGVDEALPTFGRVMGPLLRTPEQGADTTIWLASTAGVEGAAGSFWHDRAVRGTAYRPGTESSDGERRALVRWLEDVTGLSAGIEPE